MWIYRCSAAGSTYLHRVWVEPPSGGEDEAGTGRGDDGSEATEAAVIEDSEPTWVVHVERNAWPCVHAALPAMAGMNVPYCMVVLYGPAHTPASGGCPQRL